MLDPLVALLQVGAACWALTQVLQVVRLWAPLPYQPDPLAPAQQVPMTPNAVAWLNSWPDGWEREQADAALRETMNRVGDWDKAVALQPSFPDEA